MHLLQEVDSLASGSQERSCVCHVRLRHSGSKEELFAPGMDSAGSACPVSAQMEGSVLFRCSVEISQGSALREQGGHHQESKCSALSSCKQIWSSPADSLKPHRHPATHAPCLFGDEVCSHVCFVSCWYPCCLSRRTWPASVGPAGVRGSKRPVLICSRS